MNVISKYILLRTTRQYNYEVSSVQTSGALGLVFSSANLGAVNNIYFIIGKIITSGWGVNGVDYVNIGPQWTKIGYPTDTYTLTALSPSAPTDTVIVLCTPDLILSETGYPNSLTDVQYV